MLALLLAVGLAACGASQASDRPLVTIDDQHPAYRGVQLGSPMSKILRRFGKPAGNPSSFDVQLAPVGGDYFDLGLPVNGPDPPARPPIPRTRPREDIRDLRYRNVVFSASTTRAGVYYFAVTSPRARTSRGVRIGDSLTRARQAYHGLLHCDTANQGTEYQTYPYCGARLGRHLYLYFGQDPIRSIAFASTWLPPGD